MAILGSAKTGKYLLGNFELRVGPQNMAGQLDDSYSLGIVDNVTITSSQDSVDMQGMFPQEILDTAVVKQTTEVSATLREFSQRNINLLTGNGYVADTDLSGTATVVTPGSSATSVPAKLGIEATASIGAAALANPGSGYTAQTVHYASSGGSITVLSALTNTDGTLSGLHPSLQSTVPSGTSYIVPAHRNFDGSLRTSFSGTAYGLHSSFGIVASTASSTEGAFSSTTFASGNTPAITFTFPTTKLLLAVLPTAAVTAASSTTLPFFYTYTPAAGGASAALSIAQHPTTADNTRKTARIFAYTAAGRCLGYLTPATVDTTALGKVSGTFTAFEAITSANAIKFFVVGYADLAGVQSYRAYGTTSANAADPATTVFSRYIAQTTIASTPSSTTGAATGGTIKLSTEVLRSLTDYSFQLRAATALTPRTFKATVSDYNQTTGVATLSTALPPTWIADTSVTYTSATDTISYTAKLLAQKEVEFKAITATVAPATTVDSPATITLTGVFSSVNTAAKTTLAAYYLSGNYLDNAVLEFTGDDGEEIVFQVDFQSKTTTEIILTIAGGITPVVPSGPRSMIVQLGGNTDSVTSGFLTALLQDVDSAAGEEVPEDGWRLTPNTDLMLYRADDPSQYSIVTIADPGTYSPSTKSRLVTFASPVALTSGGDVLYKLQLIKPVAFGNQTSTKFFSARLILLDRADNVPVVFDFWKCTLSSGANFPINTSDFAATDLRFNVIAPSKRDEGIYHSNVWKQVEQSKVFRYAAAPDAV